MLLDSNIHIQDALGQDLSLPYEHFRYWPIMKGQLEVRFREGVPGRAEVLGRNFGFFVMDKTQKILHEGNWEDSIAKGARIQMAIFIKGNGYSVDQCPSCGAESDAPDPFGWTSWYAWHLFQACLSTNQRIAVLVASGTSLLVPNGW